jgi:hypothetical protein
MFEVPSQLNGFANVMVEYPDAPAGVYVVDGTTSVNPLFTRVVVIAV